MTPLRPIALACIALLGAVSLVGCSDDGTDDAAGSPAPSTASSTAVGGRDVLLRTVNGLTTSTYRAVYDLSASQAGTQVTGTLTLSAKPPSSAIIVDGTIAGQTGKVVAIADGTSTYFCLKAGGQESCLKSAMTPGATAPSIPGFDINATLGALTADPNLKVQPVVGQTIAGKQAECWNIDGQSGKGLFCAADNLLLLMDGTFGGATATLKAREIGQPQADDFEPPYSVTETR